MKTLLYVPILWTAMASLAQGQTTVDEFEISRTEYISVAGQKLVANVVEAHKNEYRNGKISWVSVKETISIAAPELNHNWGTFKTPAADGAKCADFSNFITSDFGKLAWKDSCDPYFFTGPDIQRKINLTFDDHITMKRTFYAYPGADGTLGTFRPDNYPQIIVKLKDAAGEIFYADKREILFETPDSYGFSLAKMGIKGISYLTTRDEKRDPNPDSEYLNELSISLNAKTFSLDLALGNYCLGFNGEEQKEFYGFVGLVSKETYKEGRYDPEKTYNTCAKFDHNSASLYVGKVVESAKMLPVPAIQL